MEKLFACFIILLVVLLVLLVIRTILDVRAENADNDVLKKLSAEDIRDITKMAKPSDEDVLWIMTLIRKEAMNGHKKLQLDYTDKLTPVLKKELISRGLLVDDYYHGYKDGETNSYATSYMPIYTTTKASEIDTPSYHIISWEED